MRPTPQQTLSGRAKNRLYVFLSYVYVYELSTGKFRYYTISIITV